MGYFLIFSCIATIVCAQTAPASGNGGRNTDTYKIRFNYPAAPHEYLWKMIACDETDERDVGSLYYAYLDLLQNHVIGPQAGQVPDSEVSFPASSAAADKDYVVASLAYYITPNELRGFEISFPRRALELKGRRYVLRERLVLAGQEFKQQMHLLTLKRLK